VHILHHLGAFSAPVVAIPAPPTAPQQPHLNQCSQTGQQNPISFTGLYLQNNGPRGFSPQIKVNTWANHFFALFFYFFWCKYLHH
jgi:hypothetical protein